MKVSRDYLLTFSTIIQILNKETSISYDGGAFVSYTTLNIRWNNEYKIMKKLCKIINPKWKYQIGHESLPIKVIADYKKVN